MSQLSKAFFSAAALTLAFGAIHLASGRDIGRNDPLAKLAIAQFGPLSFTGALASAQVSPTSPSAAVNRAGKTDRAADVPALAKHSQTISLRLNALPETSVLIRMPLAHEAQDRVPRLPIVKPVVDKPMVACEPSVSVLTEVAKHLEPGRCVT
jgi:hypothetical protein